MDYKNSLLWLCLYNYVKHLVRDLLKLLLVEKLDKMHCQLDEYQHGQLAPIEEVCENTLQKFFFSVGNWSDWSSKKFLSSIVFHNRNQSHRYRPFFHSFLTGIINIHYNKQFSFIYSVFPWKSAKWSLLSGHLPKLVVCWAVHGCGQCLLLQFSRGVRKHGVLGNWMRNIANSTSRHIFRIAGKYKIKFLVNNRFLVRTHLRKHISNTFSSNSPTDKIIWM